VLRPWLGNSGFGYENNGTTDLAFFGHFDVASSSLPTIQAFYFAMMGLRISSSSPNGFVSTTITGEKFFGVAAGDLNNDGFR